MASGTLERLTMNKMAGAVVAWLKKATCPLITFILPGIANAAYNFNFPEPVTPIARETLHIHNEFMLIITILLLIIAIQVAPELIAWLFTIAFVLSIVLYACH